MQQNWPKLTLVYVVIMSLIVTMGSVYADGSPNLKDSHKKSSDHVSDGYDGLDNNTFYSRYNNRHLSSDNNNAEGVFGVGANGNELSYDAVSNVYYSKYHARAVNSHLKDCQQNSGCDKSDSCSQCLNFLINSTRLLSRAVVYQYASIGMSHYHINLPSHFRPPRQA